jgi:hypothetical protein
MDYLLCYALAGNELEFCAIEKGAFTPISLELLNLSLPKARIRSIIVSIKFLSILLCHADQLPAPTLAPSNGTKITRHGTSGFEKAVDLKKAYRVEMPGMPAPVNTDTVASYIVKMNDVYKCASGCDMLIQATTTASAIVTKYKVQLTPWCELGALTDISGVDELKAAIR